MHNRRTAKKKSNCFSNCCVVTVALRVVILLYRLGYFGVSRSYGMTRGVIRASNLQQAFNSLPHPPKLKVKKENEGAPVSLFTLLQKKNDWKPLHIPSKKGVPVSLYTLTKRCFFVTLQRFTACCRFDTHNTPFRVKNVPLQYSCSDRT